jgi:putative Holliday junction resolvase
MRYLAIDPGNRRTGLAAGDDQTGVVVPLETIRAPRGPRLLEAIARRVADHDPDGLVVGLPLNMDGTEGPAARRARELGAQLQQRCGVPVHHQDERLTSEAARELLAGTGRSRRRRAELHDALAAAEILRDFLRARRNGEDQASRKDEER